MPRYCAANGMTVVVPPQAAERVAVKKSSAVITPIEDRCSMWQWLSTPPGVTMRPSASISRRPRLSFAPIAAMRRSTTPISARNTSAAVATVPLRTTRSKSGMRLPAPGERGPMLRHRAPARIAAFAQPPLETRKQSVEFGEVVRVKLGTGGAHRGRPDRSAAPQDFLAHSKPEPGLLLVPHQRQVNVEQVFRFVAAPGLEQRTHRNQHLRIGKAGHDAVGAALEFLRHVEPAVADHDADVASHSPVAGLAQLRELLQARTVLVLEHHQAWMCIDDLEYARHRDVGLRRLRVILIDHRDLCAECRDHTVEVADNLRFGLESGGWCDHHAAGTGIHRDLAERYEIRGTRIRYANNDGDAAINALQITAREFGGFPVAQFLRLAHHPENGESGYAALQIEFDEAVDAGPIDLAAIGERCRRDGEHGLCGRIEQVAHDPEFRWSRRRK